MIIVPIYHQHLKFNKTFKQQQNDNLAKFFQFDGSNIIIKLWISPTTNAWFRL